MEADVFHFVEEIPDATRPSEFPLYYHPQYLRYCEGDLIGYSVISGPGQEKLLTIFFQTANGEAHSLSSAPFGGLHGNQPVTNELLEDFLDFVTRGLISHSIRRITIKNAPSFYPSAITADLVLKKVGFKLHMEEINHHVLVDQTDLEDKLEAMQIRRLKKCIKAGFVVKQASTNDFPDLHEFINGCRMEKNHRPPMDLDKLLEIASRLPDAYKAFGCYDQDQLVAASICVRASKNVLYHFLPASRLDYNRYSPMVLLIAELYTYCQNHGIKHLDLGTSMLDNKPNENLISFKASMGGQEQRRRVYVLEV